VRRRTAHSIAVDPVDAHDIEAAVDPGEAIREEIRATLRAAGAEKANAPTSRLLAINVLDTAALMSPASKPALSDGGHRDTRHGTGEQLSETIPNWYSDAAPSTR
jgi:hypothetical protein